MHAMETTVLFGLVPVGLDKKNNFNQQNFKRAFLEMNFTQSLKHKTLQKSP
jgi:hypothetical protein